MDAAHGKITYDHSDFEDDATSWSEINELITEIENINGTDHGQLPEVPTAW